MRKDVKLDNDGTILSWKIVEGSKVEKGEILGTYSATSPLLPRPTKTNIVSNYTGTLVDILVPVHDFLEKGECVAIVEEDPKVPTKEAKEVPTVRIPSVSPERPSMMAKEYLHQTLQKLQQGCFTTQKLILVLDIDHTLLHACKDKRCQLVYADETLANDTYRFYFDALGKMPYYIKLRPGLKNFLDSLKNHFHIALYTMGLRPYAEKVMSIIDPDDTIISQKALCRDDHPDTHWKSLQRLFPCDESMILVVDDRADVWETPENVIKCHKFHFWPNDEGTTDNDVTARDNEMLSQGERPLDTQFSLDALRARNHDNVLATLSNVLKAVHSLFFNNSHAAEHSDARFLLTCVKKTVLKSVKILFSGVFPHNLPPQDQDAWKLAESFGATCVTRFGDKPTHVVAQKPGTEKVHRAMAMPEIKVVHVNWLYESVLHYHRADEDKFPLNGIVTAVDPFNGRVVEADRFVAEILSFDPPSLKPVTPKPAKKPKFEYKPRGTQQRNKKKSKSEGRAGDKSEVSVPEEQPVTAPSDATKISESFQPSPSPTNSVSLCIPEPLSAEPLHSVSSVQSDPAPHDPRKRSRDDAVSVNGDLNTNLDDQPQDPRKRHKAEKQPKSILKVAHSTSPPHPTQPQMHSQSLDVVQSQIKNTPQPTPEQTVPEVQSAQLLQPVQHLQTSAPTNSTESGSSSENKLIESVAVVDFQKRQGTQIQVVDDLADDDEGPVDPRRRRHVDPTASTKELPDVSLAEDGKATNVAELPELQMHTAGPQKPPAGSNRSHSNLNEGVRLPPIRTPPLAFMSSGRPPTPLRSTSRPVRIGPPPTLHSRMHAAPPPRRVRPPPTALGPPLSVGHVDNVIWSNTPEQNTQGMENHNMWMGDKSRHPLRRLPPRIPPQPNAQRIRAPPDPQQRSLQFSGPWRGAKKSPMRGPPSPPTSTPFRREQGTLPPIFLDDKSDKGFNSDVQYIGQVNTGPRDREDRDRLSDSPSRDFRSRKRRKGGGKSSGRERAKPKGKSKKRRHRDYDSEASAEVNSDGGETFDDLLNGYMSDDKPITPNSAETTKVPSGEAPTASSPGASSSGASSSDVISDVTPHDTDTDVDSTPTGGDSSATKANAKDRQKSDKETEGHVCRKRKKVLEVEEGEMEEGEVHSAGSPITSNPRRKHARSDSISPGSPPKSSESPISVSSSPTHSECDERQSSKKRDPRVSRGSRNSSRGHNDEPEEGELTPSSSDDSHSLEESPRPTKKSKRQSHRNGDSPIQRLSPHRQIETRPPYQYQYQYRGGDSHMNSGPPNGLANDPRNTQVDSRNNPPRNESHAQPHQNPNRGRFGGPAQQSRRSHVPYQYRGRGPPPPNFQSRRGGAVPNDYFAHKANSNMNIRGRGRPTPHRNQQRTPRNFPRNPVPHMHRNLHHRGRGRGFFQPS